MIEGKIAEVLDSYSVVVNRGSQDGVEDTMTFLIYKEYNISDPDSERSLDPLEVKKAEVVPKTIYEKMTVMETETSYSEVSLVGTNFAAMNPLTKKVTNQDELPTDEAIEDDIKKIKTGDPVRQIVDQSNQTEETTADSEMATETGERSQ